MHVLKVTSQVSLCSSHRLIREDTVFIDFLKTKNSMKSESVVPDLPVRTAQANVRTAQANLGLYITQAMYT